MDFFLAYLHRTVDSEHRLEVRIFRSPGTILSHWGPSADHFILVKRSDLSSFGQLGYQKIKKPHSRCWPAKEDHVPRSRRRLQVR
jgi:hypothetical protein